MIKALVLDLYEKRERYGITDVVLGSCTSDFNFSKLSGVVPLCDFLDNHEVDRITIKLDDFEHSFDVNEIKRINLNGYETIITMVDGSIFTLGGK